MHIHVRHALIGEASIISRLLYQAFIQYRSFYTEEAFAATTPNPDEITGRWHEGPVWIALSDTEVTGTVAVVSKEHGLYIRSMAVLPSARGHGIGNKLLEQIEIHALTFNIQRLFLYTTPFLYDAIHLYERFGFQQTGETHDLAGTPLLTMEKILRVIE